MDQAYIAAERSGRWRNWAYLTLQVQLAAETLMTPVEEPQPTALVPEPPREDPESEWAMAKSVIRSRVHEAAFANWFEPTRQLRRDGGRLTVWTPDEPTRISLATEYDSVTASVLADVGIGAVAFVAPDDPSARLA